MSLLEPSFQNTTSNTAYTFYQPPCPFFHLSSSSPSSLLLPFLLSPSILSMLAYPDLGGILPYPDLGKEEVSLIPFSFVVVMPGKIVSTNGELDGNEVIWALFSDSVAVGDLVLEATCELR